jgi:hypothetical protein
MSGLSDLARRLESLGGVVPDAVAKGIAFAEQQIRKAGKKPDGSLRKGNAVTAHVQASGDSIQITRIGAKAGFAYGIRPDFLALWVANAALREAAERLNGDR